MESPVRLVFCGVAVGSGVTVTVLVAVAVFASGVGLGSVVFVAAGVMVALGSEGVAEHATSTTPKTIKDSRNPALFFIGHLLNHRDTEDTEKKINIVLSVPLW